MVSIKQKIMRPIPLKMRQELDTDPLMHICALKSELCSKKIDWHHPWTYGQKGQINEIWAIIAVCRYHHDKVDGNRNIRERLQRISLLQATDKDLQKYPRKDWTQLKKYLLIAK